ncbi:MAG: hypothetical protein ACXW2S_17765 [Telluria sp.]
MRALLFCGLLAAAQACAAADPPLQDFKKPLGPGATLVGMDCDLAAGTLELAYFYPSSPPTRPMDL